MENRKLFLNTLLLLCCLYGFSQEQNKISEKDTIKNFSFYQKNLKVNALFVADYASALSENVNKDGYHDSEGVDSKDGFFMRYVRLSATYNLNDKISASVLVNLADFKSDPKTKVLENAFIKYKFNSYANVIIGQYRPYFGLEDMYGYEVNRSYYWSNQYNTFGNNKNGWQSFQLGAALTGSLKEINIPLNYYLSLVNGNGKNQSGDDDKTKDVMLRVEYTFIKGLKLGINGGLSRYAKQAANAYGIDMQWETEFNKKWSMYLDAEYKNGTNFNAFSNSVAENKDIEDYRMGGIYVTPTLRYNLNKPRVRALEFSTRYEYFEELTKNGNPRNTITPMFSVIFADDYYAKLSAGVQIDNYNKQIDKSTQWDSSIFFTQLQFRF